MTVDIPAVAEGQVWQDADPRSPDRYLRVTQVGPTYAWVRQVTWDPAAQIAVEMPGGRKTRIRLDRFRPTATGYRYVANPERDA